MNFVYFVDSFDRGQWLPRSCWEMEPWLFRQFLTDLPRMLGIPIHRLRIKRCHQSNPHINYEYLPDGTAQRIA